MTQGLERVLYRALYNLKEYNRLSIVVENEPYLYNHYFTVDISDPTDILCPLFCINHVYQVIKHTHEVGESFNTVAIPLQPYYNFYQGSFKTIDSALRYTFENRYSLRVVKIKFKDSVFYGAHHLLLAEDYKPLFMACAKYNAVEKKIKDVFILVEKLLLVRTNTPVEKAIMKKLIPYYMSNNMEYSRHDMLLTPFRDTPSILFTDMQNVISSTRINRNPYSILSHSIQTLTNSIDYDN